MKDKEQQQQKRERKDNGNYAVEQRTHQKVAFFCFFMLKTGQEM